MLYYLSPGGHRNSMQTPGNDISAWRVEDCSYWGETRSAPCRVYLASHGDEQIHIACFFPQELSCIAHERIVCFFFFNRLIWVLRAKLYLLEKTNKRRSWEAAVAIGKPGGWGKRRRQCRVMRESRWLPRRSGNVQVGVGSRNGRTECIHGIPVVYTLTFLSVHSKVWQCHMCAEACLTSLTKL